MTERDALLQRLYTIRAGLSLISKDKDDIQYFTPIIANLKKRIKLERRLTPIEYANYIVPCYEKDLPAITSLDDEASFEIAKETADKMRYYANYSKIISDYFTALDRFLASKDKQKSKQQFIDEYLERNDFSEALRLVANLSYSHKFQYCANERQKKIEEKLQDKHWRKIIKALGKKNGDTEFYRKYSCFLSGEQRNIVRGNPYKTFYAYYLKAKALQQETENDPCTEKTKKLITQYGDATKALANVQYTVDYKKAEGAATLTVLSRYYTDTLQTTHWKDLDAVIYYINDGYADTVKEALNLLLQQRQNDRVVNAINAMQKNITDTVNKGIASLQGTLHNGFETLSNQLDASYKQQNLTNAQLNRLNHAVDLNNVLQMKANLTSRRLADDMDYFRSLTE